MSQPAVASSPTLYVPGVTSKSCGVPATIVRLTGAVIVPVPSAWIEKPVGSLAGSVTFVTTTWPFFTFVNEQVTVPPAGTEKEPGVPLSQLDAVRSQPARAVSERL